MATSWWLNTSQCPCSVKPWVLHGISCFDPFLGSRKSKSNSWMLWCFFGGKFQGDPKGSTEIRIKTKTNSFQKAIKINHVFFFDFPAPWTQPISPQVSSGTRGLCLQMPKKMPLKASGTWDVVYLGLSQLSIDGLADVFFI